MTADNSGKKQRGKPFEKGRSGNPSGKPKGSRHRVTLLAEKLMADDVREIVKAVLDAAKGGDMQAARIVLDRIAPARKDSPVRFAMPAIASASEASKVMAALLAAVAAGEITPSEAEQVAKIVSAFVSTLEASEFEARLRALEERGAK